MPSKPAFLWWFGALGVLACSSVHRFPLHEPLRRDPDQQPFGPAPRARYAPFAWDGANQTVFRPISRFFAIDPAGRAKNVNALDEVPDSSWFTNRIGQHPMTPAEVALGSCDGPRLDPMGPDGSWVIDRGKPSGASPGFRVNIPGQGKFLLKADMAGEPQRASGAAAVATRLYHAAGYFAPCDSVVFFRPSLLKLTPGLTATDNFGTTRKFDQAALDKVLRDATHRDGLVRMTASRWLPGHAIGSFRFTGTRDDDPNDVIPHEDRRELRGMRLLAAWINHFDTREQNSLDTFLPTDPNNPRSPGYVRHYMIDFGDALGSVWVWDGVSRRWGHAYFVDFPYMAEDFLTLGAIERPWDRAQRDGGIFNYFSARDFDPELWRAEYPIPPFTRMQEDDGAWMARILARFTDPLVAAAVSEGKFDPASADYLVRTLVRRRDAILRRYLTRLSPLTDLRLGRDRLCAHDLAYETGVAKTAAPGYAGLLYVGPDLVPTYRLRVGGGPRGEVCFALVHTQPDTGTSDDHPSRYQVIDLVSSSAPGPLRVHLYDLGPRRGFRLAGIERPKDVRPPG